MATDIPASILRFINGKYPGITIGYDDDIFSLGFISSLFAMNLVVFIENEFGIMVPAKDLKTETFRTVSAMTRMVEDCLAAPETSAAKP
jgi:acyl carrier protein